MEYLLINLYNGNTESEQLNILESLSKILKDCQDLSEKNIIFAGDFNLFFDKKLIYWWKPNIEKISRK